MHDWLIWQVLDSAFPAGGFAHSGGLEAAWQQGRVGSTSELVSFCRSSLKSCASGSLPFALDACRDRHLFKQSDATLDAMLSNHVANRASRAQGRALLATAAQSLRLPPLDEIRAEVRRAALPAHLAPVFGVVAGALGAGPREVASMFLFAHLRGLVSAAVRLGIVGPIQAQGIQRDLSGYGSALAERSTELTADDATLTAPVLDLLQATHDRLYSRLFVS